MNNYKIAIDSGHGSNTAGKRHPDGYREHYSNTYIAYYLDQILIKNGLETFKSSWDDNIATDDIDISITNRQSQIKAANCTLSISIHANAFGDGSSYNSANGIETYIHSNNSANSKSLAEKVHAQLVKGTPQNNRGVKRNRFAMCNCTALGVSAAILIETAFMTNKEESDLLKSDSYWRETAKEIAQGVFDYLGVSGNVNVSLTPALKESKEDNTSVSSNIKNGDVCKLSNTPIYTNATTKTIAGRKTGTYYIWSSEVINNRLRVTNSKSKVGVAGQVTGWVNISDITGNSNISSTVTGSVDKSNTTSNTNTSAITESKKELVDGQEYKLSNTPIYTTATTKTIAGRKTGVYYIWNSKTVSGRVRITNSKSKVGALGQVTGWVNVSDLLK